MQFTNGPTRFYGKTRIFTLLDYRIDEDNFPYFYVVDADDKTDYESIYLFWFGNENHSNGYGLHINHWVEIVNE